MHTLSPETDNCPSWISGRERMTVEYISWSISMKECCRPRRGLNLRPPGLQLDGASNWATEAGWPFSFYAPNFKEVGGAYCFWVVRLSVRPSFRPFVTLFDAYYNFRTVNATVLKFLILIPHEKIADTYFFSWQDYAPFLSYGPLKKYGWNLVSKISQKLLKLEPWNLMNRLVVMSRQPD